MLYQLKVYKDGREWVMKDVDGIEITYKNYKDILNFKHCIEGCLKLNNTYLEIKEIK